MRGILAAVAVLSLTFPVLALAADGPRGGGRFGGDRQTQAAPGQDGGGNAGRQNFRRGGDNPDAAPGGGRRGNFGQRGDGGPANPEAANRFGGRNFQRPEAPAAAQAAPQDFGNRGAARDGRGRGGPADANAANRFGGRNFQRPEAPAAAQAAPQDFGNRAAAGDRRRAGAGFDRGAQNGRDFRGPGGQGFSGDAQNRRDFRRGDRGYDRGAQYGRDFRGPGRPGYDRGAQYGRDFRGAGQRYFSYRGRNRPQIHTSPFYYPRGYGYTRWYSGAILPSLFLSAQFFYDEFYEAGLAPPPPGTRWVRYGPDALLVDLYSGRVVDVVYDVFYW